MAVVTQPVLAECFEGGTPNATLATGAGGAANLGTPEGFLFDTVSLGTGASMVYSTGQAHSGTQSCLITTTVGSGAGGCYAQWQGGKSLQAVGTQAWFRLYLWQPANPGSTHQFGEATVGGTRCADFAILASGKLVLRNSPGATLYTFTNTVPLGSWFRIEGMILSDATAGEAYLQLFDSPDSTAPTETSGLLINLNTLGGTINQARYGPASVGVAGLSYYQDDVALSASGPVGPGPVVIQMTCGAPTASGFTAVSKAAGATSVRLKVATDQALTQNVQYVAAQAPDSYGYVRHAAAGLTPATTYYCELADTPPGGSEVLVPALGRCRTLPSAGTPQNFRVALVSCTSSSDEQPSPQAGITDWINWAADMYVYTGDYDYSDPAATTIPPQIAIFEQQTAFYGSAQQLQQAWGFYLRSDHDSTNVDNGDSDNAWTQANIEAYQEIFPYAPLGDTVNNPPAGLWQTWVAGRVRFIMIDIRNVNRSPGAATDGPSKTMLGAQQLAWFYEQLVQPEPLKVVVEDTAWMGNFIAGQPDKWWTYDYERQQIISFVAANKAQVQNMMWWHGDDHCLAVATAAKNTWGGWPVYCAAPLRNLGNSIPNVAATFSAFYDNNGGELRQYGRITITDTGSQITVSFSGWDALNQVEQISQTDVFYAPTAITSVPAVAISPAAPLKVTAAAASPLAVMAAPEGALAVTISAPDQPGTVTVLDAPPPLTLTST